MNGFVIAIGSYVKGLTDKTKFVTNEIGKVSVKMGDTCCKVPLASEYIKKVIDKGKLGKKHKNARCKNNITANNPYNLPAKRFMLINFK